MQLTCYKRQVCEDKKQCFFFMIKYNHDSIHTTTIIFSLVIARQTGTSTKTNNIKSHLLELKSAANEVTYNLN
jgi:hypothetical protein